MSLRLDMLRAAARSPKLLGDSTVLVRRFVTGQINDDGGFRNRAGISDLYYTSFGLDALAVLVEARELSRIVARTEPYVAGFDGQNLSLVHLCCLARARAALEAARPGCGFSALAPELLQRIEEHRSADGGYHPTRGSRRGTAYGAFLALGAYQDLGAPIPNSAALADSVAKLQTSDGGFCNELAAEVHQSGTNATAAATAVLQALGAQAGRAAGDWLLRQCHPLGGFLAAPAAPMPDLLSTATALHALALLGVSFERREPCLDFVDTLWTRDGGFYGHWGDDCLDCEYTFYGLLALGHLG